jgi:Mor family transcriptional regulator
VKRPPTPGEAEDAAVTLHGEITVILQEEIGFNEHFATQFAERILQGIRRRLGGQDLYIPAPDRTARDAAIRREFNGRNRDEVCRKYGISRTRLYEIVGPAK